MSSESSSWLEKIIRRQERVLRKEYEEKYVPRCRAKGLVPLVYAAWRHQRNEAKILEMLVEESELNRAFAFKDGQGRSQIVP